MPKRTLPGLGLEAYFDLGENGWNDEFDENFRKLSFLVDGRVKSRTTNLPGTGTDGDVYIVPVGQTNQNQVAIWDGPTGSKAWVYYPASEGWAFYVLDEDTNYQFNGTAWVEFAAAGGGGGGGGGPATPVPTVYMEVAKNATQAISAGVLATVVFESVVEDSEGLWDAATNSIIIPAALNGKVVVINTQTQTTADGTGDLESYLEKSTDGGTNWARVGQSANGGVSFFGITSVSVLDRAATGDRYRLRYFSSAALTLRADDRNKMTLATLESSSVSGGGTGQKVVETFTGTFAGNFAIPVPTDDVVAFDLVIRVPATTNGVNVGIRFNGDTGSNYENYRASLYSTNSQSLLGSPSATSMVSLRASADAAAHPQVLSMKVLQANPSEPVNVLGEVTTVDADSLHMRFGGRWSNPSDQAISEVNLHNAFGDSIPSGCTYELTVYRAISGGGGGSATPVPFAGFRARKNAQQTPATGSIVEITWETEDFDTETAFASNRFTVPASLDGKYGAFFVGLNFSTTPSGAAALYIQRSTDGGTNWTTFCQVEFPAEARAIGHTGPVLLTTGDIWRVGIFLGISATLNNTDSTFFSMAVLDPGISGGGGGGGAATFLELTDTPASYTGQAGKAVLVNPAADGLIFGDVAAPGGSGSSENWAVPWRGATVTMSAQTLDLNSGVTLSWDTQVVDTDNFWDGAAPTVFTIPAGVTKVRCFMTLFLDSGAISSSTAYAAFRKNGTALFVGNGIMGVEPGYNNQIQSLVSGVIDVVEGDTISVLAQFGDATIPVLAQTFFQIEVVEATDRSALSKLHPFFIPGLPGAGATVYQTVFTERTILKTTTPTRLYAGVAATGSSVFTLARNGVSVGTITVAAAGQTGTVSVAADVTFNAGDRLSVIAPGTQDATLADVAITLALQLTS